MEENLEANLTANQLSGRVDNGKLRMPTHLVGDNDGCFNCASNDNPKMRTEPTLTIHLIALREQLEKQCVRELIWCDNRDMMADPFSKGKTRIN
eukprot:4677764-Prorocentrum_lima.AAC.1